MSGKGAAYLTGTPASLGVATRRRIAGPVIALLSVLAVLLISAAPLLAPRGEVSSQVALADGAKGKLFGIFCGDENSAGVNMEQNNWRAFVSYVPAAEAGNRQWTLQEAFGQGLVFTGYTGEGGANGNLVYDVGLERGKGIGNFDSKVETPMSQPRVAMNCVTNGVMINVLNGGLQFANAITSVSQSLALVVFDSSIICKDADAKGNCINLLKVIGGSGNSRDGIIGKLTSSIYMPLSIIVAAVAGGWLAYTGIAKRRIREALTGTLWTILCFLLGLGFLLNPSLLARAPMAISNVIGTCVVGAFNGVNCMDSGKQFSDYKPDDVCISSAATTGLDQDMSMVVNGMACTVWRAFVLQPYAQGQFGLPYAELDTKTGQIAEVVKKAGLSGDDFCVNLRSSGSYDSQGEVLQLGQAGSQKVCNLAAYQMYLSVKANADASSLKADKAKTQLNENWLKIAVVAANSEQVWNAWALGNTGTFAKLQMTMIALIASIGGTLVIAVVAMLAFVYYLMSVILMAFAPFFLLAGIHPGQGRRLMLGWLEIIVSSVLKYFASAVFLVITVALYGVVLAKVENLGVVIIFLIVLTAALLMYRKEIVGLVGRVSMGGEQLSGSMADWAKQRLDRTKQFGTATAGGAIGGLAANGLGLSNLAEAAKKDGIKGVGREALRNTAAGAMAAATGAATAAERDLKRGTGLMATAAKERDRYMAENRADLKTSADRAHGAAEHAKEEHENASAALEASRAAAGASAAALSVKEAELAGAQTAIKEFSEAENRALSEFTRAGGVFGKFAQLQAAENSLNSLRREKSLADARGDVQVSAKLDADIRNAQEQVGVLAAAVPDDQKLDLRSMYRASLAEEMDKTGVASPDAAYESIRGYNEAYAQHKRDVEGFNRNLERVNETLKEKNATAAADETLTSAYINLKAGQGLTNAAAKKLGERASGQAAAHAADALAASSGEAPMAPRAFSREGSVTQGKQPVTPAASGLPVTPPVPAAPPAAPAPQAATPQPAPQVSQESATKRAPAPEKTAPVPEVKEVPAESKPQPKRGLPVPPKEGAPWRRPPRK